MKEPSHSSISPREGTPAARMEDNVSEADEKRSFKSLK